MCRGCKRHKSVVVRYWCRNYYSIMQIQNLEIYALTQMLLQLAAGQKQKKNPNVPVTQPG